MPEELTPHEGESFVAPDESQRIEDPNIAHEIAEAGKFRRNIIAEKLNPNLTEAKKRLSDHEALDPNDEQGFRELFESGVKTAKEAINEGEYWSNVLEARKEGEIEEQKYLDNLPSIESDDGFDQLTQHVEALEREGVAAVQALDVYEKSNPAETRNGDDEHARLSIVIEKLRSKYRLAHKKLYPK